VSRLREHDGVAESSFDELIREAMAAPFQGWDFSFLRGRSSSVPLPWDYSGIVANLVDDRPMLDLGTGGGEILSRLPARPRRTVATEAWAPNVPVAARRLARLGIPLVHCQAAPENVDQELSREPAAAEPAAAAQGDAQGERLPFRDGAFGLVISRHESFRASEVARVLAPGGRFVTQQVDLHWADDLRSALDLPVESRAADSWLPLARQQLRAAGLAVQRAQSAAGELSFHDVGALAYYLLKAVVWVAPEAGLPASRPALERLHEHMRVAPFTVREPRFLLVARKR
jgi:SAM-dependent methyltransferase